MRPKNWWQENSEIWFKKMAYWKKQSKGHSKHFFDEENLLINQILDSGLNNVLEVGAGDGRIIGKLSDSIKATSIDINLELSKYVNEKYPKVTTHIAEIIDLPFKDKEFDLVFTHEVLQHIEPSEIERACLELRRVGKEVWTLENWRDKDADTKVSDSHGGRWNWDLRKYFNIYSEYYTDWGQMFFKSKG